MLQHSGRESITHLKKEETRHSRDPFAQGVRGKLREAGDKVYTRHYPPLRAVLLSLIDNPQPRIGLVVRLIRWRHQENHRAT